MPENESLPPPLRDDGAPLNCCASETVCAWIMDDCRVEVGGGGEKSLEVGHSRTQGDESSKKRKQRGGGCCVINFAKIRSRRAGEGRHSGRLAQWMDGGRGGGEGLPTKREKKAAGKV